MACWFCTVRAAEANHVLETDMYGDVDAVQAYAQTKVAYNVRHIGIPRCGDCHRRHRLALSAKIFTVVMALLLIAGALAIVFEWVPPLYAGLWAGLAAGLMVGALITAVLVQTGIFTERKSRKQYPEIKELLDKGYRFGLHPKDRKTPTAVPGDKTE